MDKMDVVQRVKAICRERGISVSKLERECGFGNAYLTNLRAGKMPADRLQKVADYFGVSTKYLLTGEEDEETYYIDPESKEMAQDIYDNSDLRLLFDAARGCTPDQLRLLQQMAESWKTGEK